MVKFVFILWIIGYCSSSTKEASSSSQIAKEFWSHYQSKKNNVSPLQSVPLVRKVRDIQSQETNGNISEGKEKESKTGQLGFEWIDFNMKMPPMEEGMSPQNISELNLDLQFDDDTPSSKMTIVDPNITWGESPNRESQMVTIPKPESIPLGQDVNLTDPDEISLEIGNLGSIRFFLPSTEKPMEKEEKCACQDIDSIIEELQNRKIMLKGENGSPEISGPKGEPSSIPQQAIPIDLTKLKGERGPPGYCVPSSCPQSQFGNTHFQSTPPSRYMGPPPESLYKIVPGALVFPTRRAMLQMKDFSFVGTVAFVESDHIFYGRVVGGWRSFMMGSRVHRSLTTPTQLTKSKVEEQHKIPFATLQSSTKDQFQEQNDSPLDIRKDPSTRLVLQKDIHGIDLKPLTIQRLIALNAPQSGNMGGINQINYQCQRQALKRNVQGIFRAFVDPSNNILNPKKDEKGIRIVNLLNETLTNLQTREIFNKEGHIVQIFSFNGKPLASKPKDGGLRMSWINPDEKNLNDCNGWTSASSQDQGSVLNIYEGLKSFPEKSNQVSLCDAKHIVFCIEILHLDQINLRHFPKPSGRDNGTHKLRLSFEKYLSILRLYDSSVLLT